MSARELAALQGQALETGRLRSGRETTSDTQMEETVTRLQDELENAQVELESAHTELEKKHVKRLHNLNSNFEPVHVTEAELDKLPRGPTLCEILYTYF